MDLLRCNFRPDQLTHRYHRSVFITSLSPSLPFSLSLSLSLPLSLSPSLPLSLSGGSDTASIKSSLTGSGDTKNSTASPSPSMPSSPSDGLLATDDSDISQVGDDAKLVPNLPDSPPLTDSTTDDGDYTKMNMYSPTPPEQFPDAVATEGQTSLQTSAVSEVQGAKSFVPSSTEYAVSSHSDLTTNYCGMTTLAANGYTHPHPPSASPTSLLSPIPYTVPYNTAFGDTIGLGAYPSMSPSGYVSPYGTKQYSWPATPSGVVYPNAAFTHDLPQSCYPYQPGSTVTPTYPAISTTRAAGYPAGYFSATQVTSITTQSC